MCHIVTQLLITKNNLSTVHTFHPHYSAVDNAIFAAKKVDSQQDRNIDDLDEFGHICQIQAVQDQID